MSTPTFEDIASAGYKLELRDLRDKFVRKARSLGKTSTKARYAKLKEEMHQAYVSLGDPLLRRGFFDLSLIVFSALEQTIDKCRRITGAVDFSKGLAFYYQGGAYLFQKNTSRGISLIELAFEEDKELAHRGEAERYLGRMSADACKYMIDLLSYDRGHASLDPTRMLDRLGNDRYRLMAIIFEYQLRLTDLRSLKVKDDAETNIMRICKLTEYYLKTKLGKTGTLAELVEVAFRKDGKSPVWWREWKCWKDTPRANEYRARNDDAKIESILDSSDHTTAKSFQLLCLLRNFTAHIYNEQSVLFDRYEECFKACFGALMYTINHVG
jgi:hypothetical protein